MTATCPKCAKENSDGVKFCRFCGASMAAPAPLPAAPKQSGMVETKRPSYALWGGLAAALLILGAGGYWFMANSNQTTSDSAPAAMNPAPLPAPAPAATAPEPAAAPPAEAVEPPPEPAPAPALAPMPLPEPAAEPAPAPRRTAPRPSVKPMVQKPAPKPLAPPVADAAPMPASPAPQAVPSSNAASPQEACGKRVFLALALCMQEQCESARFANHRQCVQMRQQQKDSMDRTRDNR